MTAVGSPDKLIAMGNKAEGSTRADKRHKIALQPSGSTNVPVL